MASRVNSFKIDPEQTKTKKTNCEVTFNAYARDDSKVTEHYILKIKNVSRRSSDAKVFLLRGSKKVKVLPFQREIRKKRTKVSKGITILIETVKKEPVSIVVEMFLKEQPNRRRGFDSILYKPK